MGHPAYRREAGQERSCRCTHSSTCALVVRYALQACGALTHLVGDRHRACTSPALPAWAWPCIGRSIEPWGALPYW
eukprot:4106894-Alexandrium_andersonii.AAC.1